MRIFRCTLLVSFLWFALGNATAQLFTYSQPFELPVFINPAQVGNAGMMRFGAFYRNQWLNASSPFNTYGVSFDRPFGIYYNHAIGASIVNDVQGSSVLQHTALDLYYSFMVDLTYDFRLRLRVQAGAIMKSANYNKLIFPDMLGAEATTSENRLNYENSHRFTYDFGFGASGEYQMWDFGLAIHHIPEPRFDNRSVAKDLKMPRKYSAYASMRYNIFEIYRFKTPLYLVPLLHVTYQSRDFDRSTVGARGFELMGGMRVEYIGVFGALYYRNSILYSRQSISASVGYAGEMYSLSYAYNMGFLAEGFRGLEASVHEITFGVKIPLSKRPRLASQFDKKKRTQMTKYSRKRTGASQSRRNRRR